MNPFIAYLNSIVPLPNDAQIAIGRLTSRRQLEAGSMILRNGDICKEFHFLAHGLARVFYYKDGKEVTAWFTTENGIASAIDSLFSNKPTIYNIELLEDSDIYTFQYYKLDQIVPQFPIVERLGRLIVTANYLLLDERVKLFAFCTAEERYERLIQQLPNVFQRVSLKHIASYLGITQEHLSRIRAVYRKN